MDSLSVGSWIERHFIIRDARYYLDLSMSEAERLYKKSPSELQQKITEAKKRAEENETD